MIGALIAVLLNSSPEAYAYNTNAEEAWCAFKPVPKEEGARIPADGWSTFPAKPTWCSPGVVVETEAEHKAHGKHGQCPIVEAMWNVVLRKAERRLREEK